VLLEGSRQTPNRYRMEFKQLQENLEYMKILKPTGAGTFLSPFDTRDRNVPSPLVRLQSFTESQSPTGFCILAQGSALGGLMNSSLQAVGLPHT